jgi:hypothetical protein
VVRSTATSVVIDPTGPQVQCGKTQLASYSDTAYTTAATCGRMQTDMTSTGAWVDFPRVATCFDHTRRRRAAPDPNAQETRNQS